MNKDHRFMNKDHRFIYDYSEIVNAVIDELEGRPNPVKIEDGHTMLQAAWEDPDWVGATYSEILDRIRNGYDLPTFRGDFPMPSIVPANRWSFSDEGEEIDLDLALQGEPECYVTRKPRISKPGVSIIAGIGFSSSMNASVISQYGKWLGGAVKSVEDMGYEVELSTLSKSQDIYSGNYGSSSVIYPEDCVDTRIILSRFGEINLNQWEAFFSRGGYRYIGFMAYGYTTMIHPNLTLNSNFGTPVKCSSDVTWNESTREIVITLNRQAEEVPFRDMTEKFISIIRDNF